MEDLKTTRIYPLAQADAPPPTEFLNFSDAEFNGIHTNDFSFFEEVASIVADEPADALDPERAGQLAAIGIVAGQPFAPDERMRSILDNAARVGAGIVRSLVFAPRDPDAYYYPDSTWATAFVGGSHEFLANGARLLDCRAMMHYVGTGITPAMTHSAVGVGSQYAFTARDANGEWLDGGRDYILTLPAGIPAKTFWAIDLYDTQTRSLLQTDNPYPSIHSRSEGMQFEPNGDLVIRFGPKPPQGHDGNWLQTIPDKSWFPILRIYGPLEAWFDKTWRPGEIQANLNRRVGRAQPAPPRPAPASDEKRTPSLD